MNLPGLNPGVISVDAVPDSLTETHTKQGVERQAGVALTARAVVAVALAGAGFWYVLWKFGLFLVAGR